MRRLFYRLLPAIFSLLVLVASAGVKPACFLWYHQPEVPSALRK